MMIRPLIHFYFIVFIIANYSCKTATENERIDRFALVKRHNVVINKPDTLGSLTVGNGEFAFTVDVTGLQTFYKEYENGISLGTQTQWAWHSIAGKKFYSLRDVAREFESCDGSKIPYAIQHDKGQEGEASNSLRANPHRLHLGIIGLILLKENGEEVELEDLENIDQELDLWTGKIESNYKIEGAPVKVICYSDQEEDKIAVRIESSLIQQGRLKIRMRFPYGKDCHVCPGYDWENSDKHLSLLEMVTENYAFIERRLDTTQYTVGLQWTKGKIISPEKHSFELEPDKRETTFDFIVLFSKEKQETKSNFTETEKTNVEHWKNFWTNGGAIDFSQCTDPRAKELERRVVLSQYLTKVQCAGSMPPQETGLTMNSWYGKFHLEMHWWHAAHFALWDREELLEKSFQWYHNVMPKAMATAQWQNHKGARWQKMTDPQGNESPSGIGAFIIWQQPHPIYFSELMYRQCPTQETLMKYKELVFNTADFMVSFLKFKDGKFHLCHPLIPAQEIFKAMETDDPAYELQYWYYGLSVAQQWRTRLGLQKNKDWENVLKLLAPLSVSEGLYLPNVTTPTAYTDDQYRKDHPAVLGAYGFLPLNERIDTTIMGNTLKEITAHWNWESTWGWDYPLIAMTAARLNKPEMAVNALLMDTQKNTYLVNGHNYQDKRLRLYLPGNGGLLAAVAMMAAGWDGNKIKNPGFPKNGKWNVRWEGLQRMP
jgi:hypothetical protein